MMVARSNTYSVRRPNPAANNNNNNNSNMMMTMDDPFSLQYNNTNNMNMKRNASVRRTRSINAHIYTSSNDQSTRSMSIGSSPYDFANSLATHNKGMKPLLNNNQIMSPYQVQRQKMQKAFVFNNGEIFTPKATPVFSAPPITTTTTTTTSTSTSTSSPKKSRGKISGFFKGLVRNKSISRESQRSKPPGTSTPISSACVPIPIVTVTVPTTTPSPFTTNTDANILQRLEKQWDTVHLNTSFNNSISTPTLHSTSFGSSLSISLNDSLDDTHSTMDHVRFASEIYVDETYSGLDYERADPEDDGKGDSGVSNFNNNSIKLEVNHYKRNEMFVHPDSRRNTHFFR